MADSKPKSDLPTTQWSLIARLKDPNDGAARAALDEICRSYHYPLYCQIRRRGLTHHDAEDALHEFFAKLLRLDTFQQAEAEKGRLRTFLLIALRRFLTNWNRDTNRIKGREVHHELVDAMAAAERRYRSDKSAHHESPDRLYDRQWASELMNHVLERLRGRYAGKGREPLFETLRPGLLNGGSLGGLNTAELARNLGISAGALRTAFHRLLDDYREELRLEILQTVENQALAKIEYDELIAIFSVR